MDRRTLLSISAVLLLVDSVLAASPEVFTGLVEGTAAGGFDAVSYFQGDTPRRGEMVNSFDWQGAKWLFATPENLAAFKTEPEKYAPQFGGYCAYAVSKGATAKGDPEVFTVLNGKVYFNFSKSVQVLWRQDVPGNIAKAEANWPKVLE